MTKTSPTPRPRKIRNRVIGTAGTFAVLTATSLSPAAAAGDRPWWHARSIGDWYLSLWGVN